MALRIKLDADRLLGPPDEAVRALTGVFDMLGQAVSVPIPRRLSVCRQ
ncbi:hypothetical protein [Candidatus Methylomirabilis sp.]